MEKTRSSFNKYLTFVGKYIYFIFEKNSINFFWSVHLMVPVYVRDIADNKTIITAKNTDKSYQQNYCIFLKPKQTKKHPIKKKINNE